MTGGPGDDSDFAELAERLHWHMFRIATAIRRREYDRVGTEELTLTQCSILYALSESGRTRLTELAAREGVRKPTMTMAISRLEDLGMVTRSRDTVDKRVLWIELTARGRKAQRDAVAVSVDGIRAHLTPADLRKLQAAMKPLERWADVAESEANHGARRPAPR